MIWAVEKEGCFDVVSVKTVTKINGSEIFDKMLIYNLVTCFC